MIPQSKIRRVLRLISLLSDKPSRNAKELSRILETSPKTIYDYIKLLEDIGYGIDKDGNNAYFLFEPRKTDPSSLLEQELNLLNQLIDTIPTDNPLKESMRKKLYLCSELVPLAEELNDRHMARIVQRLATAIEDKKQVCLFRYQSATGARPTDRIVEPLFFQKNNSQLAAYDINKKEIRHFKIKRIEEVEILNTPCIYDRETFPTDIFGFTDKNSFLIKLQLSKRAYRLLIEEFPDAKPFITIDHAPTEKPHRFVYEARSPIGIGRFILGLPGEILIEEPAELKNYIRKRVSEFLLTEDVKVDA